MISLGAYRYHGLSTLSRCLFVNLGWLFAGSFFIAKYGGDFFAPLHFLASVLTICCYILFMCLSLRGAQISYLFAFALAIIFTAGHWGGDAQEGLAVGFFVSVLVIDFVGATISGNLLQASVNPAIFKRIYQKMISIELFTRLLSTAAFFFLSKFGLLNICYPIMIFAGGLHVFSMLRIRYDLDIPKVGAPHIGLDSIRDAVRFVRGNPLVKLALLITVWTYTIKFLGENLYYQAVELKFSNQSEIGGFLSQLSFGLVLFTLCFNKFFADKLVERRTPSQLFLVLPVGIVVLLMIALISPPFWPIVGMYIFFMLINRGLQLPVSRQCLVPVPDAHKHAIVTLIFLVSGISSIIISGSLSYFKDYLAIPHYIYLMIGLTLPIFVPLLNVDTHYVRNLWRMYSERIRGLWVEDIWVSPSLNLRSRFKHYHNIFDDDYWCEKEGRSNAERALLAEGYRSENGSRLRETVRLHKRLLTSERIEDVKAGLAAICEIGLKPMRTELIKLKNHPHPEIRKLAHTEMRILELLDKWNVSGLRSHSRRKLKAILHRCLGREMEAERLAKLQILLSLRDRRIVAKFLDLLNFYDCQSEQYNICWQMIEDDRLTIMPLIEKMLKSSYSQTATIREILLLTDLKALLDHELRASVVTILGELTSKYYSFWTRKSSEAHLQSQLQHGLFLEELRLRKDTAFDAVIDSIEGLFEGTYDDKLILCSMHLEVLKKSKFRFAWQAILDQSFYMNRAQFDDRTVRKFRFIDSIVPEPKKGASSSRQG